jgi:PAS domain S-box-containing protein
MGGKAVRAVPGIQLRFFLALAMLVILSMSLLGVTLFVNQRQILEDRLARDTQDITQVLRDKGEASSAFLARIAPQGLLTYDYLLLEGYVEELSADPDIVFAVILNAAGTPLTHYLDANDSYFKQRGMSITPRNYEQALAQVRADHDLMIVRRDINYDGAALGSVEVGMSRMRIKARTEELHTAIRRDLQHVTLLTATTIAVSLILLIVLIEWTFSRLVVKPLRALSAQMARVQDGDLSARASIQRRDEIGRLADSFNHMAGNLQNQLQELEEQRQAFKETRDYLASILDNSADMIATTALDGTVVEFNTGAEHILGYTRAEVAGHSADSIYCDQQERQRLYNAVRQGDTAQHTETRLKCKDGALIDVDLTLSPLRNNAGDLIGAVCIGRDITQAKALRRELIQAEKLASVGQVAGWIAHQIRNLLGRLLMDAAALHPEAASVGRTHAHRDLTDAIASMDRLVTDLLDYSKTLSLHTTPIDINAALNDMLKALPAGTVPLHVERDFATDLTPVAVDVFKLEQAIGNLFKNAIQAMPEDGLLRVQTRKGPRPDEISISIEDNGPGIPESQLDKVFQPFFTTKPGGTGLGLAMCARIVEAHGGRLTAANVEPHGARFTVVLPVSIQ